MNKIIEALETIQSEGTFCTKVMLDSALLKLELKDFGSLKFPLNARSAKQLIKLAKPAKFGWRDQTLLDMKVRNAWELKKSRIKIDQRHWNKTLKPLVERLKGELGLPECLKLKAELHNLLIYEPGQFFSPHQDSEKCDGMVATLLVVLPSSYRGGHFVIDHQGSKKHFRLVAQLIK